MNVYVNSAGHIVASFHNALYCNTGHQYSWLCREHFKNWTPLKKQIKELLRTGHQYRGHILIDME